MTPKAEDDIEERLLDLFVYAPLGLVLEARELIPRLAERGRGQVALTRLAATVGAKQAESQFRAMVDDLADLVSGMVSTRCEPGHSADTAPTEEPPEPVPDSASPFPIDDYDERTAAEIVDLLTDLSAEELRLVDAYEEAQRNRVTIRNRIRRRLG